MTHRTMSTRLAVTALAALTCYYGVLGPLALAAPSNKLNPDPTDPKGFPDAARTCFDFLMKKDAFNECYNSSGATGTKPSIGSLNTISPPVTTSKAYCESEVKRVQCVINRICAEVKENEKDSKFTGDCNWWSANTTGQWATQFISSIRKRSSECASVGSDFKHCEKELPIPPSTTPHPSTLPSGKTRRSRKPRVSSTTKKSDTALIVIIVVCVVLLLLVVGVLLYCFVCGGSDKKSEEKSSRPKKPNSQVEGSRKSQPVGGKSVKSSTSKGGDAKSKVLKSTVSAGAKSNVKTKESAAKSKVKTSDSGTQLKARSSAASGSKSKVKSSVASGSKSKVVKSSAASGSKTKVVKSSAASKTGSKAGSKTTVKSSGAVRASRSRK